MHSRLQKLAKLLTDSKDAKSATRGLFTKLRELTTKQDSLVDMLDKIIGSDSWRDA